MKLGLEYIKGLKTIVEQLLIDRQRKAAFLGQVLVCFIDIFETLQYLLT